MIEQNVRIKKQTSNLFLAFWGFATDILQGKLLAFLPVHVTEKYEVAMRKLVTT